MANPEAQHATYELTRDIAHPPARVFAAFADPEIKARWFAGPGEWVKLESAFDFQVGGQEVLRGGMPGGPVSNFRATYQDIVLDRRIIFTSSMSLDDVRITISITTFEFTPTASGTLLKMTEQSTFLDEFQDIAGRKKGSSDLIDALIAELDRTSPS